MLPAVRELHAISNQRWHLKLGGEPEGEGLGAGPGQRLAQGMDGWGISLLAGENGMSEGHRSKVTHPAFQS